MAEGDVTIRYYVGNVIAGSSSYFHSGIVVMVSSFMSEIIIEFSDLEVYKRPFFRAVIKGIYGKWFDNAQVTRKEGGVLKEYLCIKDVLVEETGAHINITGTWNNQNIPFMVYGNFLDSF